MELILKMRILFVYNNNQQDLGGMAEFGKPYKWVQMQGTRITLPILINM